MLIATFDVGTTALKGALVNEGGEILLSSSEHLNTIFDGDHKEQRPEEWYEAFCRISSVFLERFPEIDAIIMSGQMQDVIPVKRDGQALGNAILYSDGRAEEEAQALLQTCGAKRLEEITGNHYDGSLSLPKILWLKKHQSELYREADAFLISAKDYLLLRLTGKMAGDVTACSTAGAMDIRENRWSEEILRKAGIDRGKLPELYLPHQCIGTVSPEAALAIGYPETTRVYAGIGDAGATTLASGIAQPGEYNINLGTSGWVAMVSEEVCSSEGGVFNLAAFRENAYINVVPFLNAGNVHRWISQILLQDTSDGEPDYEEIERLMQEIPAGSHGVTFLPYLNGERFPVMDTEVKGTFLGITPETGKGDLAKSCLEGVAFSIRQGIGQLGSSPKKISVIGGGGRTAQWDQILADMLGQEVYVFRNPDILPILALSSAVLLEQGLIKDYTDFTRMLQDDVYSMKYVANPETVRVYDCLFEKYLKVYPAVSTYYRE